MFGAYCTSAQASCENTSYMGMSRVELDCLCRGCTPALNDFTKLVSFKPNSESIEHFTSLGSHVITHISWGFLWLVGYEMQNLTLLGNMILLDGATTIHEYKPRSFSWESFKERGQLITSEISQDTSELFLSYKTFDLHICWSWKKIADH